MLVQDVPKGLTFILLIDDQVPTGFVGRFQLKTSDNFEHAMEGMSNRQEGLST